MGYAVLHINKPTSGGGLGNHIDRKQGHEHSFPNADPDRMHLNQELCPSKNHMLLDVQNRIKEGYNGKRKIRTDAVTHITTILSGSHDTMKEIENEGRLQDWYLKNYEFAKAEFGEENIVRFTLHMDERTPHIHCVTVPLLADGRLSAKEMMGSTKKMRERQTRYAEEMKEFNLERGIENSKNSHITTADYYKGMELISQDTKKINLVGKNALGFVSKDKTLNNYELAIRGFQKKLYEEQRQVEELSKKNHNLEEDQKRLEKNIIEDQKYIQVLQRKLNKIILDNSNKYLEELRGIKKTDQVKNRKRPKL